MVTGSAPLPRVARLALGAALLAPAALAAQQPPWTIEKPAQHAFGALWKASIAVRRERVACMAGTVTDDSVRVTAVEPLAASEQQGDSLNAPAERSIAECGPPTWIGTVHTHVRSTDDPDPAPGFSPQDRMVMSLWSGKWAKQGAFCVIYGAHSAHCESYPPHRAERKLPGQE